MSLSFLDTQINSHSFKEDDILDDSLEHPAYLSHPTFSIPNVENVIRKQIILTNTTLSILIILYHPLSDLIVPVYRFFTPILTL